MNAPRFTSNALALVLQRKGIATISELSSEFGDCSHRTLYRKLNELDYLSSYSHRGMYYTLRTIPEFDAHGLWFYNDIGFSHHGTLSKTLKELVASSPLGYRSAELDVILKVRTANALGKLVHDQQLHRICFQGKQIYCSPDPVHYKRQLNTRRMQFQDKSLPASIEADLNNSKIIALFYSLLHEKHRRLFAGMLSQLWGYGGDLRVERLLGISRKTVHKGRIELNSGHIDPDRIRNVGGGRPSIEKKNDGYIQRLEELMEFETAGSPMGEGLFWTYRSPRKIARQLHKEGYHVSASTVRKTLRSLGYSVRKNRKCLSRPSPPGRDQQFQIIFALILYCQVNDIPMICVDTKKKELIGWFINAGGNWSKKPIPVNDHDFLSYAEGKAVPYGIYDRNAHRGSIYIGDSKDTPEFAVDCIAKWFSTEGKTRYPNANRLIILADCGGPNSNRAKAWKYFLQKKIGDRFQVQVTVAHYPSGSSKWNPIEHRLFSAISLNWRGRPLDSFQTMMNYIITTTDKSGLKVDAVRVTKQYETGIKISKQQMKNLNLVYGKELPHWNYDIYPTKV